MNPLYSGTNFKKRRQRLRRTATYSEKVLWQDLRNRKLDGIKFYRQFSIGHYICDFYSPETRVAIELDGISHTDPRVIENDKEKSLFLELNGIRLLRFTDDELFKDYERVLEWIGSAVKTNRRTPPTPSFQEGAP